MNENVVFQELEVNRKKRESSLGQTARTIWFTGLSGSGKSTLANELEKKLYEKGLHTMLLDGDNIRMGLNENLGFSDEDRVENIRRIAHVCKLLNDAGIIVLTSFVSPFEADRQRARDIVGDDDFFEVYVSTSLEECERRDVKGLYKRARAGEIPEFTGISSPYEPPSEPEIEIDTGAHSLSESVDILMRAIGVE